MFICAFSGPGASASAAFTQSQQMPGGVTPPPHQPVIGLAQAQANNSNNKTSGGSMSATENSLPEDLQRLMDDWSQDVLIVTHRPHTNSLSIHGQLPWDQAGPQTLEEPITASDVSFLQWWTHCLLGVWIYSQNYITSINWMMIWCLMIWQSRIGLWFDLI